VAARLPGIQPKKGVEYEVSLCNKFFRYIAAHDLEVEVVKTTPEVSIQRR
jgi:hypothetical protein